MTDAPKVTKEQLLKIIDDIEKNPSDKLRILGDAGISLMGVGLGAAAAGSFAAAAGATSIAGLTTAASWVGLSVIAATPVGWIVGSALAGGTIAYGVSRLIRGGSLAEGRKAELLQGYREAANEIQAKERTGNISANDRSSFIISLRELIDKNAIPPVNAFRLIEQVEQGHIPLSQAFTLIQGLLLEEPVSQSVAEDTDSGTSENDLDLKGALIIESAVVRSFQERVSSGGESAVAGIRSFGNSVVSVGASIKASSSAMLNLVSTSTGSALGNVNKRLPKWLQKEPDRDAGDEDLENRI